MQPAIEVLLKKRNEEGTWNLNAKYPGQTHISWVILYDRFVNKIIKPILYYFLDF